MCDGCQMSSVDYFAAELCRLSAGHHKNEPPQTRFLISPPPFDFSRCFLCSLATNWIGLVGALLEQSKTVGHPCCRNLKLWPGAAADL